MRGERLSKALSNISVEAGPLPPWGEHSEPQTTSRDLNSWTGGESWAVIRGPFPAFKLCHPEAKFLGPVSVPGEADEARGA